MKKLLLTSLAIAATSSVFAQGTVVFNNLIGSVALTNRVNTRIYSPEPGNEGAQKTGNTAANEPAGTQTYAGALLTGNGWTAQMFALPGSTIPIGPLTSYGVPVNDTFNAGTPTTTFRTGSAAGLVSPTTATLTGVPLDAPTAVLQLRVFPSSLGSWAAAVSAWNSGAQGVFIGASPMFVVNNIGGGVNTPPNMVGLQSFNLVAAPEPSSFALAGLGMASLLIFRRRK